MMQFVSVIMNQLKSVWFRDCRTAAITIVRRTMGNDWREVQALWKVSTEYPVDNSTLC